MVHHFEIEDARRYGVNAAVILNNIQFWIKRNEANGENFYDGKYWTYNSVRAYSRLFPYLSEKQIRTAIEILETSGVISRGNHNKDARDRTAWYCLGNCICPTSQMGTDDQKGNAQLPDTVIAFDPQGEPLPDSILHIVNSDSKHSAFTSSETEEDKSGSQPTSDKVPSKKRGKKSPPGPAAPPEKSNSTHAALMEVYYMWFKSRNDGIRPNINGREGKALIAISNYFKGAINDKLIDGSIVMDISPDMTDDEIYKDHSVKMFSYILNNWNKLSRFLQEQTTLSQINSNLTNIINGFKNGSSEQKRGSIDARTNTERVNDINEKIKQQYSQQE